LGLLETALVKSGIALDSTTKSKRTVLIQGTFCSKIEHFSRVKEFNDHPPKFLVRSVQITKMAVTLLAIKTPASRDLGTKKCLKIEQTKYNTHVFR